MNKKAKIIIGIIASLIILVIIGIIISGIILLITPPNPYTKKFSMNNLNLFMIPPLKSYLFN